MPQSANAHPAGRRADHPVDPDIIARWSPRAYDGSAIDENTLLTLFEAARWAPSAYNYQPWRFVWELRGSANWDNFLAALLPFNAAWAKDASALVFILSDRLITLPGKEDSTASTTASFDAGAAWGLLALQATKLGLHTHAMAGFEHARASALLGTDDRYRIEAAVAIGRIGNAERLPDTLRTREFPSPRRPVEEIAFRGRLP